MCGIVGLYLKNSALFPRLGELFKPMLVEMSSRGPDSAGVAIYRNSVANGSIKYSLAHDDSNQTKQWLSQHFPDVRWVGSGESIEIFKETGLPEEVYQRFDLASAQGQHMIGHTRMATESAVTTAGSHPFATGADLCLVHNGSLSNHNRLREQLQRLGVDFHSENDSEVAAAFLTYQLRQGLNLRQALELALTELDGFYTFCIGTRDGFAVLRDPIACKHAVLAEHDDWVAMATEYRALATLPGAEDANIWEPKPATVYHWGNENTAYNTLDKAIA